MFSVHAANVFTGESAKEWHDCCVCRNIESYWMHMV